MSGVNGRGAGGGGGGPSASSSALVESLVSGDRQGVGGILCNDPTGLCVATMGCVGDVDPSSSDAMNVSGVYTNLVHLASQLQPNSSSTQQQQQPPLITLETSDKAILVKDYAGYAVAVQIPKKSATAEESQS